MSRYLAWQVIPWPKHRFGHIMDSNPSRSGHIMDSNPSSPRTNVSFLMSKLPLTNELTQEQSNLYQYSEIDLVHKFILVWVGWGGGDTCVVRLCITRYSFFNRTRSLGSYLLLQKHTPLGKGNAPAVRRRNYAKEQLNKVTTENTSEHRREK